jgi:hypothetical protein
MSILQTNKGKPTCLATSLLLMLFSESELLEDVNVNGKSMNGTPNKNALDPKRIQIIKTFCLDRISDEISNAVWKRCVNAIHKKLYNMRLNLKENSFAYHTQSSAIRKPFSLLQTSSPASQTSSPALQTSSSALQTSSPALQTSSSALQTSSPASQTSSNYQLPIYSGFDALLEAAYADEQFSDSEYPASTQN